MDKAHDLHFVNQLALTSLEKGELYQAQEFFRKNVKINPGFVAFNNLGAFYIFEGMAQKDDHLHKAQKLGIRYLKKAQMYQKSNLTMLALGTAHFYAQNYEVSYKYFKAANRENNDYTSAYNCGVACYECSLHGEAAGWFKTALHLCTDNANYWETLASYAYALLLSGSDHFQSVFCKFLTREDDDLLWDKFILAYFSNDWPLAKTFIKPLWNGFFVEAQDLAIIFDILIKSGDTEEAMQYLQRRLDFLESSAYNTQREATQLKRIYLQTAYRKKVISEYRHKIPLATQCCYCRCEKHNITRVT